MNHRDEDLAGKISGIKNYLDTKVVGLGHLTDAMITALLCQGHLLIEGRPGLAKTRAVRYFSGCVSCSLGRIQFTPDMLPSDITGNDIYDPQSRNFKFSEGPLFANIILADEINRAPAKVQSALLEAMQERQITVNGVSHILGFPFMVLATQNPLDQEGTFELPEAQKDRFLMSVSIRYPSEEDELEILRLIKGEESSGDDEDRHDMLTVEEIRQASACVKSVYSSDIIEQYIVRLVQSTRPETTAFPEKLKGLISEGAGPRATLGLDKCSRARAWLSGRDYVSGDDVRLVARDVLRHRIRLSLKALHDGIDADTLIGELLEDTSIS